MSDQEIKEAVEIKIEEEHVIPDVPPKEDVEDEKRVKLETDSNAHLDVPIKEDVDEKEVKPETDPYAYLERDEFSSEKFKISVKNLPRFYGVNEFRKLLNNKLKLGSNKIKFPRQNSPYVFVCFRSEEDKQTALKTINGYKWKGKELGAWEAKPAPDPLVKRRNERDNNESKSKRAKIDENLSLEDRLKFSTTPLWNIPYEEQLKMKKQDITEILLTLGHQLQSVTNDNNISKYLKLQQGLHNKLPCEFLDVRHAAEQNGYRNKCEFTIGIDEETSLPTVGFRIGSYAKGNTGVGAVENLPHISDTMKLLAKVYQDFVRDSNLQVFDAEYQTGHFKQLMVRTAPDQLMIVAGMHPQNLTEEELAQFKNDLIKYFFEGPGKVANVTSLYYKNVTKKVSNEDVKFTEHLAGETHIQETILGLSFRISPEAFFQINTPAAEVLYSSAIELAQPTKESTVLDICCGTGTIGLCFAKSCKQVLGVEIIPEAVVDAKENAKSNKIENCDFFAGKAEEILGSVLYRVKTDDVIAVVDPPRAGLHQGSIKQLRKSEKINKLLYVSCNPNAAMKNFVDLARPDSKTLQGDPFIPVKAIAVDMFPHTKHCELIILFQRWTNLLESGYFIVSKEGDCC